MSSTGGWMGRHHPEVWKGGGYRHLLQVAVAAQLEDDAHVDVGVVVAPAAADELRDATMSGWVGGGWRVEGGLSEGGCVYARQSGARGRA